jgi:hypothetical protein
MTRAIGAFVVAAFSIALLISAAQAQQAGTDPGVSVRKGGSPPESATPASTSSIADAC